jgi:hypothetical protein
MQDKIANGTAVLNDQLEGPRLNKGARSEQEKRDDSLLEEV